ncbi:MAG: hypothetical protein ABL919_05370 [Methylococcales bacterium]|nr:hypothetical protein [Methylococcaceae bacterium]
MKYPGYALLKALVKERELTLSRAMKLLPIKFGDYRDLYPLATLYTDGFAGVNLEDEKLNKKNNEVAKMFYAMLLPKGTVKSDGLEDIKGIGWSDKLIFFCTAKTDLFFAEAKNKRVERIFALFTGIVIAVVSATVTAYLKNCVFA